MGLQRFLNAKKPSDPSVPNTTIVGAITSGDTSVTFADGTLGDPTFTYVAGQQFQVVLDDEITLVTALNQGTGVATIARAQEGTSASSHGAGAYVYAAITKGGLLASPLALTTSGDLPYLNSSLQPARLAAPADGSYAFSWSSAVPSWTQTPTFTSLTLTGSSGTPFVVNTKTLVADATNGFVGVNIVPTRSLHIAAEAANIGPSYDIFISSTVGAGWNGRKARGTAAAPRRAKNGDVISGISAVAAEAADDVTDATFPAAAMAQFRFFATEDITSTNRGSKFTLQTCSIGSSGLTTRLTVDENAAVFTIPLTIADTKILKTTTNFTNGAGAAAGTLNNAPAAGNPTKWIPIDDNGTTRYLPAW